ncbi:hypothetical protein B0H16DRAFT_1897090 [Mycena metata]|uniref:Uncharacterized protein n=1 Tax=Mycena metata TaxID=1033252 RepID=A0AAD7HFJ5_9AGAR|nr:hypothetical protein B0H16DRAFT_1897090 [Mycena metata]
MVRTRKGTYEAPPSTPRRRPRSLHREAADADVIPHGALDTDSYWLGSDAGGVHTLIVRQPLDWYEHAGTITRFMKDLKDRYCSVCRKFLRNRPWTGDESKAASFAFDKERAKSCASAALALQRPVRQDASNIHPGLTSNLCNLCESRTFLRAACHGSSGAPCKDPLSARNAAHPGALEYVSKPRSVGVEAVSIVGVSAGIQQG